MNVHVYDTFLHGRVFILYMIYICFLYDLYTHVYVHLYITIVRNFLNIYLLFSNYHSLLSLLDIFSEFSFLICFL